MIAPNHSTIAQQPAGTVFWSHTREDEKCAKFFIVIFFFTNPCNFVCSCNVCNNKVANECSKCQEQIELRPGYAFCFLFCCIATSFFCLATRFCRAAEFVGRVHFLIASRQRQEIKDGCTQVEGECGCMLHEHCLRHWLEHRESCPKHTDRVFKRIEES